MTTPARQCPGRSIRTAGALVHGFVCTGAASLPWCAAGAVSPALRRQGSRGRSRQRQHAWATGRGPQGRLCRVSGWAAERDQGDPAQSGASAGCPGGAGLQHGPTAGASESAAAAAAGRSEAPSTTADMCP